MDRNAKLRIAIGVVVVLALIAIIVGQPLIAVAVVVLGGIGTFVLLRQGSDADGDDDDGPVRTKGPKPKKGKARLDEILDDKAAKSAKSGGAKTTKRPTTSAPASGGLPTWTPGSVDGDATETDGLDEAGTTSESNWDSWEKEWPQGDDADTLVLDEDDDPLRSLDRLDEIDPVADVDLLDSADDDPFAALRADVEVDDSFGLDEDAFGLDELDELDVDLVVDEPEPAPAASGSAFSFAAAPAVINEEVSTADDIMAASTATELHTEDAGDSELARLLAKVQARLSAYE